MYTGYICSCFEVYVKASVCDVAKAQAQWSPDKEVKQEI